MNKIEITCEDNMALMGRYPDNHFELAIIDAEYGIGASKPSKKPHKIKQKNGTVLSVAQKNYTHKNWDNKPAGKEYFDELLRVSKHQIIFGINYYDYKFPQSGRIVWDKLNGESDQMGCEIAYCSFNKRTDMVYYMWSGMFQGVYCGKEVRKALVQQGDKSLNEKRIHPTQKPVKLYEWLLTNYAKQGDKILDTHGGSMSIAIACHNLGFDLTLCELDEEYFNAGMKRLELHKQQLTMKF